MIQKSRTVPIENPTLGSVMLSMSECAEVLGSCDYRAAFDL